MVLEVNTGVVNEAPVNTTLVSAASLYQVNTGLIIVVLEAVNVVPEPLHIDVVPVVVISLATALGFTIIVTALALAAVFSHLLLPFTVT